MTVTLRPPRAKRILLTLCVFASGASGLLYELLWTRILGLTFGHTVHAMTTVLAAFMGGLALGSFLYSRFRRIEGARLFAALQLGVALFAFLLVPLFDRLPGLFFALFKGFGGSFEAVLAIQFVIVFAVVLAPTTLMGMTFPCLAGLLARRADPVGADVGTLYAFNTLGAIAGSIVTGFVLIPGIGAHGALALAIAGNAVLGATLLVLGTSVRARIPVAVVAAIVTALLLLPRWDRKLMSSGVFHLRNLPPGVDALVGSRVSELLYFRDRYWASSRTSSWDPRSCAPSPVTVPGTPTTARASSSRPRDPCTRCAPRILRRCGRRSCRSRPRALRRSSPDPGWRRPRRTPGSETTSLAGAVPTRRPPSS